MLLEKLDKLPIKLEGEVEGLVRGAPAEVGNEQSLRVGFRFWSSSTILLEPLQTCPGTALRAASAV